MINYKWNRWNIIEEFMQAEPEGEDASKQSSLLWLPPPLRQFAFIEDIEGYLKKYGCEYLVPVKGSDEERGDLVRRKLFLSMMHKVEGGKDFQYTLRRMCCHRLERVTAAVRKDGKFHDTTHHRDVLFVAYCGLVLKREHHLSVSEFYGTGSTRDESKQHVLVPPRELDSLLKLSWADFCSAMCRDAVDLPRQQPLCVAHYAQELVRFLIPSYTFSIGPIPDPSLWGFRFTVDDVEDLYHSRCTQERLLVIRDSLDHKRCFVESQISSNDSARKIQLHMVNLAYSIHILLWGLYSNDGRLLEIFRSNEELLVALETSIPSLERNDAINYLLRMLDVAKKARQCDCASHFPWTTTPECPFLHHFWESAPDLALFNSIHQRSPKDLEELIRDAIAFDDTRLLIVYWKHTNDRIGIISAESDGSYALSKHWEKTLHLSDNDKLRVALILGTDRSTSDKRHGEGIDRVIPILVSYIRKLLLSVRLCHENVRKMDTKYWRFSGGERSVITIPYGRKVIVVREIQPERLHSTRIIDIGMNLKGRYSIADDPGGLHQLCELEHDEADESHNLRGFMVQTARKRGGTFDFHGFCDGDVGGVHEVRITVILPSTCDPGASQFDDLQFRAKIDNEDAQVCSVITVNNRTSTSTAIDSDDVAQATTFLRLGIHLHDVVGIKPDHVVLESGESLGAALDGETLLESENQSSLTPAHRSQAMQISPALLSLLSRTHRYLQQFWRSTIEPECPELMHLFTGGIRVLGLANTDVLHAVLTLENAMYTVQNVSIDDISFATQYDKLKRLTSRATMSLIYLTVLSPLPDVSTAKLVNLTRNSSLRLIIEASKSTVLFFEDPSVSYSCVELLDRCVQAVERDSPLGMILDNTSVRTIYRSFETAHIQPNDLEFASRNVMLWSERQHSMLSLENLMTLARTQHLEQAGKARLVYIVVCGEHPLVNLLLNNNPGGDVVFENLGMNTNQRDRIQELLLKNPRKTIVVCLFSFDLSSAVFDNSIDGLDTVSDRIEPSFIFRPDLVIRMSDTESQEERVARILGCRPNEWNQFPSLGRFVDVFKASADDAHRRKRILPTFQAFLCNMALCAFLPHWTSLTLYMFYILKVELTLEQVGDLVEKNTNNIFSKSIWNSLRLDAAEVHLQPSFVVATQHHRSSNASGGGSVTEVLHTKSIISSAVRDGRYVSGSMLRKWLHLLPSAHEVQHFITHALSPLSVFFEDPITTASLLLQAASQPSRSGIAPLWAQRVLSHLQCQALIANFNLAEPSEKKFLSVVRFVLASVGASGAKVTGSDLDTLSDLGVIVDVPVNHELPLIQLLFSLDNENALVAQVHLSKYLLSAEGGGISDDLVNEVMERSQSSLGALFSRVIQEADVDSCLFHHQDIRQLAAWARNDVPAAASTLPRRQILLRITPAGWLELLISSIEAASPGGKWLKMITIVECIPAIDDKLIEDMTLWAHQRQHCDTSIGHLIIAFIIVHYRGEPEGSQARIMRLLGTCTNVDRLAIYVTNNPFGFVFKWPLQPLDNCEAASTFSRNMCRALVETLRTIIFCEGSQVPEIANFELACQLIQERTTASSQRFAINFIMEGHYQQTLTQLELEQLKFVSAAFLFVNPLAPSIISLQDSTVILLLSKSLHSAGKLQVHFSDVVKNNIETASPLVLALVGWIEYVPTTFLRALSRLGKEMWSNRVHIAPVQSHTIWNSQSLASGKKTPPYIISFVPRPLPLEQFDKYMVPSLVSFSAPGPAHKPAGDLPPFEVSNGVNEQLIRMNLEYMIACFNLNNTRPRGSPVPSHEFISVKLIILWFACLGANHQKIVDLIKFSSSDILFQFSEFLEMKTNTLTVSTKILPYVVDAQLRRSLAVPTKLFQLDTEDGRIQTREALLVHAEGSDNLSFLSSATSKEMIVMEFAKIAATKFSAICNLLRLHGEDNSIIMHANDMLQPTLLLQKLKMNDLAKLFCKTMVDVKELSPNDRGILMLAAIPHSAELVEAMTQTAHAISASMYDEIQYFSAPGARINCSRQEADNLFEGQEESACQHITDVIASVSTPVSGRIEFPDQSSLSKRAKPIASHPVEQTYSLFQETNAIAHANCVRVVEDNEDSADNTVNQYLSLELVKKKTSGRSIDISLILRLVWDNEKQNSFYLTLVVTPGSACHLVERDGNLEISDDVSGRDLLSLFNSHHEAWNYCRTMMGPVTLVGKGFFLFRSRDNPSVWRCFLGRSIARAQPSTSSQDTSADSRFYFWHIAAYHAALCVPISRAMISLLHILSGAVFTSIGGAQPFKGESVEAYKIRVLETLTSLIDENLDAARDSAAPLLAYTRLLLRFAQRMRSAGGNMWERTLTDFHMMFPSAAAPPRIGSIHDVEIDVLTNILGELIDDQSEMASMPQILDDDPSCFIPKKLITNLSFQADLDHFKTPESKECLASHLSQGNVHQEILKCVQLLSNATDSETMLSILSEKRQERCNKLRHVDLAFHPLPIDHAWSMLLDWTDKSVGAAEKLHKDVARNNSTGEITVGKDFAEKVKTNRAQFYEIKAKSLSQTKHSQPGEGIGKRTDNEIEHCWTHINVSDRHYRRLDPSQKPSPHVLWVDANSSDNLQNGSPEPVAYILDALFCYRDVRDEPQFVPLAISNETKITVETLTGSVPSQLIGSIDGFTIAFDNADLSRPALFTMEPTDAIISGKRVVRFRENVAPHDMLSKKASSGWTLARSSSNTEAQFFHATISDDDDPHFSLKLAKAETHFRALMFRWFAVVIGSPLSLEWKIFFVHHAHVNSEKPPPITTPLIGYCLAKLCPSRGLREALLGALGFRPNRLCARRDKVFGVIVTPDQLDFQNSEWNEILDKVGPITLKPSLTEPEQYLEIVKNFALLTTHVVVQGKPFVSDELMKWCSEFTKRYPWRTIIFVQCSVRQNMPEIRDRVVDLNEMPLDQPKSIEICFDPDARARYIASRDAETRLPGKGLSSSRISYWSSMTQKFVEGASNLRVVLLVSAPGAGKTMELANIEYSMSHGPSPTRFINFDCSGDALVQQALVTLLDNALLGVELGVEDVVLVADEYHMLSRSKKAEFLRWAESKIGHMRIVLIANRDDIDDELLSQRLMNVSGSEQTGSMIWRARVGASKILEALSTVRMNPPSTAHKTVVFFSTIRTLISDSVVSLRMASETCTSPFYQETISTPLEVSLRAKLQPENAPFVMLFLKSFDAIYKSLSASSFVASSIVDTFNQTFDPIDLLAFTAMLPALLLWNGKANTHQEDDLECDKFLSFVEFVSRTSAYHVHPAVRLSAWTSHTISEVEKRRPRLANVVHSALTYRPIDSLLTTMQKLSFIDHPSFFPIIRVVGIAGSQRCDLDRCPTLVFPHHPSLEGIYVALARHEALDWGVINKQWIREPVTDLDTLMKILRVVPPEKILMHLPQANAYSLLQRDLRYAQIRGISAQQPSGTTTTATSSEITSENGRFQNIVLCHYPWDAVERENGLIAPYFWSVWNYATALPLDDDGDKWINFIKEYVPPPRAPSVNDVNYQKRLRSAFLRWAAAHGRPSIPQNDATERTIIAARVFLRLSEEYFSGEKDENRQHALLWRSDVIAPLAAVKYPSLEKEGPIENRRNVLGVIRAFQIASYEKLRPHSRWPRDMQLLSKVSDRRTLLSIDDVNMLAEFVSLNDTTPPRIIGAMLQASPAGGLRPALQNDLLSVSAFVDGIHLCEISSEDLIVKNVSVQLLLRARSGTQAAYCFTANCEVARILQDFIDQN